MGVSLTGWLAVYKSKWLVRAEQPRDGFIALMSCKEAVERVLCSGVGCEPCHLTQLPADVSHKHQGR